MSVPVSPANGTDWKTLRPRQEQLRHGDESTFTNIVKRVFVSNKLRNGYPNLKLDVGLVVSRRPFTADP